jgi:acyl-coenzyme A synthetase/AMP-(fatty) acid ligase/acyl carrier protein
MVLAHGDGLVQGPMMALGTGCALIRAGGFAVDRIEDWLDTVRREGATHVITVPTVWAMIDRYAQHSDYFAAPDFRGLSSVAAYLDPTLWDRLERRFGHPITNQYGLTETVASALYAGSHPETGARHTVGRPIDCEARVVPIGEGDAGELQLRGDNIFAGYWGDKDRTSRTLVEDGWMRTGDLARKRDDGSYEIVGRLKTVIMSGGFLIRPEEIDEAMRSHPGVRGAVTVGVEDPLFGEVPVSLVEVEGDLGEVELVAHARQALEPLKVPKRIVVAEAIPRGDAGKPRLDAVRALIAERLSEEPSTRAEGRDLEAAVIETAARVFRLEPSVLSLRSAPETVPGWDSFTQIALILALEERFGLRIPTSRAAAIRSLASALEAVQGSARKT